jgi:hypothetical protein
MHGRVLQQSVSPTAVAVFWFDTYVSVHYDIIYGNDQHDATV